MVSGIEPSSSFRYRCRVCGGPRVPLDDPGVKRSGREDKPLKAAQRAALRAGAWKVAVVLLSSFAMLSSVIAVLILLIARPGWIETASGLAVSGLPWAIAFIAWRRAKALRERQRAFLDQAWAIVAGDLLTSRPGEVTVHDLAHCLRLKDAEAELLLAELSRSEFVGARVSDAGEVVYYTDRPPPLRVSFASQSDWDQPEPVDPERDTSAVPRSPRRR
ncbi:MAG TPA: hypothetical protein VGJ84_06785 [Polyangiaceae bacterium]